MRLVLMRLVRPLLAVLLLAACLLGLWQAGQPRAQTPDERLREVTSGLRCPTCAAESVADSPAETAKGMRAVAEEQLAAGRSPEEVREWFAQRYGEDVLLDPPRRGFALLVWVLPAAASAGGALLLTVAARRREQPARESLPAAPRRRGSAALLGGTAVVTCAALTVAALGSLPGSSAPDGQGLALDAARASTDPPATRAAGLELAAQRAPDDPDAWLALAVARDREHDYEAAATAYRHLLALRPQESGVRVRLALALLRGGRADEAEPLAREVLAQAPEQPEALLALGLAQRARGAGDATETLRRFLAVAPDHPAAAQVRRLVEEQK